MKVHPYLNSLLLIFFCVAVGVCLYNIDFSSLVDPAYYLDAAFRSESITSALYYGDNWFTDVGFIFISYIYRLTTSDFHVLAWLFSFGISLLIFTALTRYVYTGYLFMLILMCVLSFSTVGIVFNVWRQGYAEGFILLSAVFPSKRIHLSVLAALFHFNTAVVFLVMSFVFGLSKENLKVLLPVFIALIILMLYIFFRYQFIFEGGLNMYSKSEASSPWLRYIYTVVIFSASMGVVFLTFQNPIHFLVESYIFKIILILLCFSLVYVLFIPVASERYLHYFFLLFPFFLANIFSASKLSGQVLVYILSIIHCSLTFYFMLQSDTWQLVDFIPFI